MTSCPPPFEATKGRGNQPLSSIEQMELFLYDAMKQKEKEEREDASISESVIELILGTPKPQPVTAQPVTAQPVTAVASENLTNGAQVSAKVPSRSEPTPKMVPESCCFVPRPQSVSSQKTLTVAKPKVNFSEKLKNLLSPKNFTLSKLLSPKGFALFSKEMPAAPGFDCEIAHPAQPLPKNLRRQQNKHAMHFQATKKWSKLVDKFRLLQKHNDCYIQRAPICNTAECPVKSGKVHRISAGRAFCRLRVVFAFKVGCKPVNVDLVKLREPYHEHHNIISPQILGAVHHKEKCDLAKYRSKRALEPEVVAASEKRKKRQVDCTNTHTDDSKTLVGAEVIKTSNCEYDTRLLITDGDTIPWGISEVYLQEEPSKRRNVTPIMDLEIAAKREVTEGEEVEVTEGEEVEVTEGEVTEGEEVEVTEVEVPEVEVPEVEVSEVEVEVNSLALEDPETIPVFPPVLSSLTLPLSSCDNVDTITEIEAVPSSLLAQDSTKSLVLSTSKSQPIIASPSTASLDQISRAITVCPSKIPESIKKLRKPEILSQRFNVRDLVPVITPVESLDLVKFPSERNLVRSLSAPLERCLTPLSLHSSHSLCMEKSVGFPSPAQNLDVSLEKWLLQTKSQLWIQLDLEALLVPQLNKDTFELQSLVIDLKIFFKTEAENKFMKWLAHLRLDLKIKNNPRFEYVNEVSAAPVFIGITTQDLEWRRKSMPKPSNSSLAHLKEAVICQDLLMSQWKNNFSEQFEIHDKIECYLLGLLEYIQATGEVFVKVCMDMANYLNSDDYLDDYEDRLCDIMEDLETMKEQDYSVRNSIDKIKADYESSLTNVIYGYKAALDDKKKYQCQFYRTWKNTPGKNSLTKKKLEEKLGCTNITLQRDFFDKCINMNALDVSRQKVERNEALYELVSKARDHLHVTFEEVTSRFLGHVYESHGMRRATYSRYHMSTPLASDSGQTSTSTLS